MTIHDAALRTLAPLSLVSVLACNAGGPGTSIPWPGTPSGACSPDEYAVVKVPSDVCSFGKLHVLCYGGAFDANDCLDAAPDGYVLYDPDAGASDVVSRGAGPSD